VWGLSSACGAHLEEEGPNAPNAVLD